MVFSWFKRHCLTSLTTVIVLVVGLCLPIAPALADPMPPPEPSPTVKTFIPKPEDAPHHSAKQSVINQVEPQSFPIGVKTDIPKPKDVRTDTQAASEATTVTSWSVSLTSSNYSPKAGERFTLTAIANMDVTYTPFFIRIFLGTTQFASCGTGRMCSVTLYSDYAPAYYTFQARIEAPFGTFVQATDYVSVQIVAPWRIGLVVSSTTPDMNQRYSVSAYVNQIVDLTPYYIEIYANNITPMARCGLGRACTVTLATRFPQNINFQARVSRFDGSDAQIWSAVITISIRIPSSAYLFSATRPFPFESEIGSAGNPLGGSNNCGPASAAMVVNYWKGSGTTSAKAAAVAIRGSAGNHPGQGGTNFKDPATINFLTNPPYSLKTNPNLTSYDDVRREIALGRPVIILVNNFKYQNHNPAPYPNLGNGAFVPNHIVVVTGYNANSVFINDPLRQVTTTTPSPADYEISVQEFKDAATTTGQTLWFSMSVYP